MKISENLLIGASTAAHQVEGNNRNSDCWILENMEHSMWAEPSGIADDHYNRYKEDIQLMAKAGYQAYRFSIEWARIEPEMGKYSDEEIQHYKEVLLCCEEHNIIPIVTMHHFSSPAWLMQHGGWESEKTPELFAKYCGYVVERLGAHMPYICTINEANMGLQIAKLMKYYMPTEYKTEEKTSHGTVQVGINTDAEQYMESYMKSVGEAFHTKPENVQIFISARSERGDQLVMEAHMKARDMIRKMSPDTKVGITFSLFDYQPVPGGESRSEKEWEDDFKHYLPAIRDDDFFGLQNYTRKFIGKDGDLEPKEGTRLTMAGYEFYPEALGHVIRHVAEDWKKPIFITENGIATDDDKERVEYITKAVRGVQECINEGIHVKGYFHWSLMDNYEWQAGYKQTFGLIAVDRDTMERKPKPSFYFLGDIAQKRKL
ncbi:MAG: family 1 glycosylhydrolase [Blautia sp.]|nr:family 1 glycosylhydrolase [Lachnoclostridium sp.]MCM1211946.1 family 1 glycosylhydrolase [Blautia sp.]